MRLALTSYAWKRRESNNTYYDEEESADYLMDMAAEVNIKGFKQEHYHNVYIL